MLPHQVVYDAPHLAQVGTDGDHEGAIVIKLEVGDPRCMLMFYSDVVEELSFVKLDNIENFLRLLQLLANLQVLQTVLVLQAAFSLGDELLKDLHALLTLAHRDEQVGVQCLTLTLDSEDEFAHFGYQLSI